jgi:hypothetical protein
MNRTEVSITEPKPIQPDLTTLANETNAAALFADEQPTSPIEGDTPEPESVVPETVITPFLDEQPAFANEIDTPESGSVVPESGAATPKSADQPIPVVTTTAQGEPSDQANPLLAILVGILLGVIMSLAIFRRRLIDAVMRMVRGRTPANTKRTETQTPPSTRNNEETAADVNTFDTSEAEAAFSSSQKESGALPIGDPAENTYIVEASEAAPTEQIESPVHDLGVVDDSGAFSANPDDKMLAMLFNDSDQTADGIYNDIFDPTGGADTEAASVFSEPTVEMPEFDDEQIIDPELDPELDLPTEMDEELLSDHPEMLLDETVEMPGTDSFDGDLNELTSEEEDLSQSLQEAMSLLEGDFDNEFTASQVIERTEATRSLEETETEDADNRDLPEQKVSG